MSSDSGLTLSIRLIRSFEHRNLRFVCIQNVDSAWTTEKLMEVIREKVKTSSNLPPPFKNFDFDTLKIEHQAHGAKTNDPVLNCHQDEELMLKPGQTLANANVRNETEVAFFKLCDYRVYQEQQA